MSSTDRYDAYSFQQTVTVNADFFSEFASAAAVMSRTQ